MMITLKIESIKFFVGLTPIFLGGKGDLKNFAVLKGALKFLRAENYLHQALPLTNFCERSL